MVLLARSLFNVHTKPAALYDEGIVEGWMYYRISQTSFETPRENCDLERCSRAQNFWGLLKNLSFSSFAHVLTLIV